MTSLPEQPESKQLLNLFDSTCLIVGIVVGSGIYETPATVAQASDTVGQVYLFWILGGVISLCGAMCYAELATTYPEAGGDVVYLNKAYGRLAGFLFGWLQTFVAKPGDISLMALVFARYVHVAIDPTATTEHAIWPANAVVVLLTLINVTGIRSGKITQNVLTVIKMIGLAVIVALAFASSKRSGQPVAEHSAGFPMGVALVVVLFTYGGWNEMVFVASEVRNPKRNLSRALIFGTAGITIIYLITNAAFLSSLTLPGLAGSNAVATDAVANIVPVHGRRLFAIVITISAAGAINGLVFTGARVTAAMRQFRTFRWLGGHSRSESKSNIRAMLMQAFITCAIITIAGNFTNALIYTSAAVYTFYLATSTSTVVLRLKDPHAERSFRMPLYPLPLIVFAAGCTWAIYSAIIYKPIAACVCFAMIAFGALLFVVLQDSRTADNSESQA